MRTPLSIAVVTNGKSYAARTLAQARAWADMLGGELVVAGDGDAAVSLASEYADRVLPVTIPNGLGEYAVPALVNECAHEWILRLDDDELGSAAMLEWLLTGEWVGIGVESFAFPRMWLWGDEGHFIVDSPLFPDPQTRLLKRDMAARWANHVHAGAPAGRGRDVPVAILHHKFLVRSFAERQETARIYDSLSAGAGSGDYFGKFTLPELFFVNGVTVRAVGNGATDNMATEGDAVVECSRKTGVATTLTGKDGWGIFATRQPRA